MRKIINIIESTEQLAETPQQVRAEIEAKIGKIPDEADLRDVLKFTNRYTIKGDVTKFATLRNYKDMVSSVFLQTLADANLKETEVKKFLKQLSTNGILDARKLMTPRKVHSYTDLIDPAYKNIFDAIKVDLFQKISGKIGEMGDVGKGEYMLDIISPAVHRRGAPGDLAIAGKNIELKAGENGRLGPAGSMSLAGRFQREFLPFIAKIMPSKIKSIKSPTDFNLKQDMSYFSAFFETSNNVKRALLYMLKMHYPDYDVKKIVNAVVGAHGNINGQQLKEEMLKASYASYKAAKEFDGIIIMDAGVTKFLYIGSPEDIAAVSNSLNVSFPSWTDQQGNCMKITLAKGRTSTSFTVPNIPQKVVGKRAPTHADINKLYTDFAKEWAQKNAVPPTPLNINAIAHIVIDAKSRNLQNNAILKKLQNWLVTFNDSQQPATQPKPLVKPKSPTTATPEPAEPAVAQTRARRSSTEEPVRQRR